MNHGGMGRQDQSSTSFSGDSESGQEAPGTSDGSNQLMGGFGRGGRGGMREGMPSPPEGMEQSGMPTPPEGMEQGGMPTPPEGMEQGEMPSAPEGMQQGGAAAPEQDFVKTSAQEDTADASAGVHLTELSEDAWIRLGASAAVLTAGIAAALIFRRGRAK